MRPTPFISLVLAALLSHGVAGCRSSDADVEQPSGVDVAAPVLDAAMANPEPWVRAETARLLGETGDPSVSARLQDALRDPSPLVQNASIAAMVMIGDADAATTALSRLVAGTRDQKLQLLGLLLDNENEPVRDEALRRALRDADVVVREHALDLAIERSVPLESAEVDRLIESEESIIVTVAFRLLVARDPARATRLVLTRMRDAEPRVRASGLALARHLALPELWPTLRSWSRGDDMDARTAALLALGRLGDPEAEEGLRNIVLSGTADEAAAALDAIAWIDSPQAREQAGRLRNDSRTTVRHAALEVMQRLEYPVDAFAPFLEDEDPDIGRIALVEVQSRDAEWAAALLDSTLRDSAEPARVLHALLLASLRTDLTVLLDAAGPRLAQLSASNDPVVSGLATRLLLQAAPVAEHVDRIVEQGHPESIYALIEASLTSTTNLSDVYAAAMTSDLMLLRVAGAVGALRLRTEYSPSRPHGSQDG
jgi:HEAT repeat protein